MIGCIKINWDEVYNYLKIEKYHDSIITGPQVIKQLGEINEENRILFLEYHNYRISNLPGGNDVYTVKTQFPGVGGMLETQIRFKNGQIDTSDAPVKRHNFSNNLDYQNYIDGYIWGKIQSILDDYKTRRKHIIRFLLNPKINNINLTNMNQQEFNEYLGDMVNKVEISKFDNHMIHINGFLKFHQHNMKNKILFHTNGHKINVPRWDVGPASIEEANEQQLEFYYHWLNNYKNDIFIDINGVLDYLFLYIYEIVYDFIKTKNIIKLNNEFRKIDKNYGHYKEIKTSLYYYWTDAYLWADNYGKHLEYKIKSHIVKNEIDDSSIDMENIIVRLNKSDDKDPVCDAFFLVMGNKRVLTPFGLDNLDDIIKVTEIYLKGFKLKNGLSIKEYFYNKYDFWNLSEDDFNELKEYIIDDDFTAYGDGNYRTKSRYFEELKLSHIRTSKQMNEEIKNFNNKILNPENYSYEKRENFDDDESYNDYLNERVDYAKEKLFDLEYEKSYLFISLPYNYKRNCFFYTKRVPQIIDIVFKSKEASVVRECENIFREKKGIPRIGEGWVSETNLYRQILEAFPNEKIVHHRTPAWLGRQHLDIYFPEKNIGIEYQGLQHNEPVEFFGGAKAYKKQQKRDKKKAELCKKNNCVLIYVYPDYDFEEVKEEIENLL